MIFILLDFFREYLSWHVPAVFAYSTTRMALSSVTALLLCIFLGPRFIAKLYELKVGQPIRQEDCPVLAQLHAKKADTPTMGGILILASMLLSMLFFMDLTSSTTLFLLSATVFLGAVGAYDDYLKLKKRNSKGLSSKRKFIAQCIFGAIFAAFLLFPSLSEFIDVSLPYAIDGTEFLSAQEYFGRLYVPFFKDPVWQASGIGMGVLVLFFLFVIVGSSNAVNLTDGLDGLAAGCLILTAATLAVFAFISNNLWLSRYLHVLYIEGAGEIAVYLSAFCGACLGFLWYNGHPAQVFMGDTGSLALGGILGVIAVLLRRELLLGLVGGIFVAETLSVIIQVLSFRYRKKKRVFLCSPLHHHFEYKGWHEVKVVIRFWIIGLLLAIIAIASLKFQ